MHKWSVRVRRLTVAACVTLLALVVMGCGPNLEKEVRETIDATFATLTDPEATGIAAQLDAESVEQLQTYGVDADDFLHHAFERLTYTIDEVVVSEEGDRATAQLTVSNVNLDAALQAALADFEAWQATDDALTTYKEGQEAALFQKLFELLYEEIAAEDAEIVSNPAELVFLKGEEGWDLDGSAEGNEAFLDALLGGTDLSSL